MRFIFIVLFLVSFGFVIFGDDGDVWYCTIQKSFLATPATDYRETVKMAGHKMKFKITDTHFVFKNRNLLFLKDLQLPYTKVDDWFYAKSYAGHIYFDPFEKTFDLLGNGQDKAYKAGRFQLTMNSPELGIYALAGFCESF